jgi:uncharacterized protein (TIGR03086 family)
MTDASDRYRANADGFDARVVAVPADRWENQSPCEDWTARDVVRHVVATSAMFLGFIDQELPPAPSVDEDPVAAWHSARDAIQRALDDARIAQKEYDGMFGQTTFEQSVGRFLAPDAFVHTWDLARATGLDDTLPEAMSQEVLEALEPMDDKMRGPGAFGEKIDPPANADVQTRLLCFLGRRP